MSVRAQVATGAGAATRTRPRDLQMVLGLVALGCYVLLAFVGSVAQGQANLTSLGDALQSPGASHWFGTDAEGRDIFLRVCVGAGISMAAGALATAVGAVIGTGLAMLCALGPSWADTVIMRLTDALLAFPALLLAMAITVGLGSGLTTATLGITITIIPLFTRVLRSEAMRVRGMLYMEAATSLGVPKWRAGLEHMLPAMSTTLLIQAAANFGGAILALAALGFVGLGAQPPTAEWGSMITQGLQYTLTGQWWMTIVPGTALLLLVATLSWLAERLRRRLNPYSTPVRGVI